MPNRKVVCIEGDGIGTEVTRAMKAVVAATGAPIEWIDMPAGLRSISLYGDTLPQITLDAITEHRLAIKGPTNTPKGDGHVSVNVRLRKHFDLHVGLRPFRSLPFSAVGDKGIDILMFRQNTEGLYACTEEEIRGSDGEVEEVRLTARFTRKAMLRLADYAFTMAARMGCKRVTVVTKSNIHKAWGRMYRKAFMEVAARYPDIEAEELLVDATAQALVTNPHRLSSIVTENMFGDILSDECAGLIGGLGVAPGANIGDDCAIFEAVHGSADDIAGQDKANPTALILSAAMLLDHIGHSNAANWIRRAIEVTIQSGITTGDLSRYRLAGTKPYGTATFTDEVCAKILRWRYGY